MQVLQHQQHRGSLAEPAEQTAQPLEQPSPAHLGRPHPLAGRPVPGQFGQHPGQLRPLLAESGGLVIISQRPQRLQQRRVRQRASGQRRGTTHRDQRPRPAGLLGELAGQPTLAHPRLTGDQQHPRPASRGTPQGGVQAIQLLAPPDEHGGGAGRAAASAAPIATPPGRPR